MDIWSKGAVNVRVRQAKKQEARADVKKTISLSHVTALHIFDGILRLRVTHSEIGISCSVTDVKARNKVSLFHYEAAAMRGHFYLLYILLNRN